MDQPVGQSRLLGAVSTYLIFQDLGIGDSQPQNMPGTEWKSERLHNWLWGLFRQDLPITNCRLANGQRLGIEEIRIRKSGLQVIGTVLSLGIWTPIQVSWRCCRPTSQSGTLD